MVVESQSSPRWDLPAPSPEEALQAPDGPPSLQAPTPTDTQSRFIWLRHCEVIQLREWVTDQVHPLPAHDIAECLVGSEPSAGIRLTDPKGFVSRKHACLTRAASFWQVENLGKNGIRENGVCSDKVPLTPGVEVGIGSLTLVAENQTLVHLRRFITRVLGWDAASRPAVNLAIRALRTAAHQRTPLVLAGADDLVAVARQIHLRTKPAGTPFVVCGPRPHKLDLSLRVTATHADATAAYELAASGTVCVRAEELPGTFAQLVDAARDPRALAQLIICTNTTSKQVFATAPSIVVPELTRRAAGDVQRIISEYAADSMNELGAAPTSFTEANREWVTSQALTSFANIELETLRLVALNNAGNVHQAAARLGVSHVGLGGWFKRRGIKL